jgi:thioesterase domain-containing protein
VTAVFCIGALDAYGALIDALGPALPALAIHLPSAENELIETSAESYLHVVREHQPTGPYRLLGFSFAGIVAYEMAAQLTRAGEDVELVVMLDIWLPEAVSRPRPRQLVGRLRSSRRERQTLRAISLYRPTAVTGRVLVVRARETVSSLGHELVDPSYGWGRYASRLAILDVPGGHLGTLSPPAVGVVAREMRALVGLPA